MERYNEYKDSSVQWLREIPRHWKEERAKYLYKKEQRPVEDGDEIVTCFRDGEVTLRRNRRTTGFTEATDYSHYQHICKGDLVIHQMDAFAGSSGVSDSDGMGTPVLSVCTGLTEKTNNYYFAHILRLMGWNGYILSLYRGIRERSSDFRFDTFSKLWLPLPPLSEQYTIVSYLDDKCAKIDKMLEGKQKQIELLAEMKQRIIAETVTRGLDSNVEMKTTNIPWLPEIPEHWKEQRMASLFTGEIEVNKDFEFKHAFKFNYGQLVPKNEIGDPEEYREVYVKYSKIKSGDILINGLNLNYDFVSQRVACAPSDGIITSAYVVCRPRTGVNYDYYTYLFKSMDSMKLFHGMGTGIRLTLSFKELKKQIIPIPPQSEQNAVVKFIKDKEAKFDALTSKLQQEIESIKEYKQRLISDVVTGQIKVC